MANNGEENKIKKFTKEAIGKTLNQFNKEIGMADLVEINKNQDRILNGILSQVNDENTEKTEKSNIITLDNSTDGIVELKEIQGDTNVNVSKIEEMPITHDIGEKEGNVFTLNEITKGAISIGEIQGNTMVNCNKDDKKELVLMTDLSTQGDNNITLTEGIDGGRVDVALEGNTLVNVSKTKEETPITHESEDTTGNHIALADEGHIRPVLNGKTMVNVCDQKNSTAVTKVYTVENSGNHITLQDDVDGSCRPFIEGNTLVNIAIRSKNTYDYLTHEGDWTIFNADGNSTHRIDPVYPRNELIKADTTYTVIIDVSQNTLDSYLEFNWSGLDGVDNGTCIGFDINIDAGATGRYIYIGNSKSDIVNQKYIISPRLTPSNSAGLIKFRTIILEGDYTDKPIPDYFEGLQSSFEDNLVTQEVVDSGEEEESSLGKYKVEYKVTGKNKCRIDTFSMPSDTYYITLQTQFKEWCPNLIVGKKYKMLYDYSYSEVDTEGMVGFAVITNDLINLSTFVYTEEIGSKYIYVYGGHKQGVFSNIRCIEYDSADDSYEPYKESTKTLYLNSPLLEDDTIEERNNSIYHVHRSKQIVFDGSDNERWEQSPSNDSTKPNYFIWADGMFYKYTDTNQLCDKMKISNPYDDYSQNIVKIINGSARIRKDDYLEVGISSWLQSNPITLVAQLVEPIYELIEQQSSLAIQSYANGHLDLASAVPIEKVEFKNTILENKYLYTNTEYTVQFEADKVGSATINLGGTTLTETSIVKGINKISITTPETLTDNNLVLEGIGFNISDIVVTPAIEQDFGYFGGLSSTFEDGLVTQEMVNNGKEEIDNLGKYKVNYYISGKPQRFGRGGRI